MIVDFTIAIGHMTRSSYELMWIFNFVLLTPRLFIGDVHQDIQKLRVIDKVKKSVGNVHERRNKFNWNRNCHSQDKIITKSSHTRPKITTIQFVSRRRWRLSNWRHNCRLWHDSVVFVTQLCKQTEFYLIFKLIKRHF